MDWDSRQEYIPGQKPPRPASAPRQQRVLSATSPGAAAGGFRRVSDDILAGYGATGGSPDWKNNTMPASPPRRVQSALPGSPYGKPALAPLSGSRTAWDRPSSASRRVHAQAIALSRPREVLAEDVMALKEELHRTKEDQKHALVEVRRLEGSLSKHKQNLLKAEELLNNRERLLSPTVGLSQMYRNPETTSLVSALKEQCRELRGAKEQLAAELAALQKATRATRLAELQSEVFTVNDELARLRRINQLLSERLSQAEAAASDAVAEAQYAKRAVENTLALGVPEGYTPVNLEGSKAMSGGGVRKTLQAMASAHKLLVSQAAFIRTLFPPGMSPAEFTERAKQRVNTAGAPEVLAFLNNHMDKIMQELSGQPGASAPPPAPIPVPARERPVSARADRPTSARRPAVSRDADLSDPHQLKHAVAGQLRTLRAMDPDEFKSDPRLESGSEQLGDVMGLYIDELRRLQGKPPLPAPAPLPAAAPAPVPAEPPSPTPPHKTPPSSKRPSSATSSKPKAVGGRSADLSQSNLQEEEVKTPGSVAGGSSRELPPKPKQPSPKPSPEAAATPKAPASEAAASTSSRSSKAKAPEKTPEKAADKVEKAPAPGSVPYRVVVHTSNVTDGAFDGKVFVKLHGEDRRKTEEVQLDSDEYAFDSGNADEFTVMAADVGPIKSVFVRMESSATDSSWHLAKVEVGPKSARKLDVYVYNNWLEPGQSTMLYKPASGQDVDYRISVTTGDVRGAGTDGQVLAMLVGDNGCSPEIPLDKPTEGSAADCFARGRTDMFEVRAPDVGPNKRLVLRLTGPTEDAELYSGWFVASADVLDRSSGKKSIFNHNAWVCKEAGPATLMEADCVQAMSKYKVVVHTTDLRGADFDGHVYIKIDGWNGSTPEIKLASLRGRHFRRAAADTFTFLADDVGQISSCTMKIVPTEDDPSWHMDHVEVTNEQSGNTATFYHAAWLNTDTPSSSMSRTYPLTEWRMVLVTGEAKDGGFDGEVYVTLQGTYCSSTTETLLVNESPRLAPGSSEVFTFKAYDIGTVNSIQFRLVATGKDTRWNLDRAELECLGSADAPKKSVFEYKEWLGVDSGAVTVAKKLPQVEYQVAITTMDDNSGATPFDGDVYFTLEGSEGKSDEIKVPRPEGDAAAAAPWFKPGGKDVFSVTAGDVGQLSVIRMRVDMCRSSSTWFLGSMTLLNKASGATSVCNYNSTLYNWYSSPNLYPQGKVTYTIMVATSDQPDAGFDGQAFLTLKGSYGSSEELLVTPDSGSKGLVPGHKHSFTVEANDLGSISAITVRAGHKGHQSSAWHLASITVDSSNGYPTYLAEHHGWVRAEGAPVELTNIISLNTFKICLKGAADKAPFTGRAWATLVGSSGEAGVEVELDLAGVAAVAADGSKAAGGDLELSAKMRDVGSEGLSLKIRTQGGGSAWDVRTIKLQNESSGGSPITFWSSAPVPASGTATFTQTSDIDYEVAVVCTDVRGNGTDGQLKIRIQGDRGSTDELDLVPATDKALERSTTTRFIVRAADMGSLSALEVSLVGSPHSGLQAERFEVVRCNCGLMTAFPCNDWIKPAKPEAKPLVLKAGSAAPTDVFCSYEVVIVPHPDYYYDWYTPNMFLQLSDGQGRVTNDMQLVKSSDPCKFVKDGKGVPVTVAVKGIGLDKIAELRLKVCDCYSGFRLERVEVSNLSNGAFAMFKTPQDDQWLYGGYGSYMAVPPANTEGYYVYIDTRSDQRGTFDGEAKLRLVGDGGRSEDTKIVGYGSGWAPGSCTGEYITAYSVGRVKELVLTTVQSGSSSEWKLGSVQLAGSIFRPDRVIKAGTTVVIPKEKNLVDYDVTIQTSDVRGAGTDAQVSMQLLGDEDRSEWFELRTSESDFARGSTFTKRLRVQNVGPNKKVVFKLTPAGDSSEVHSAWHVKQVDVLDHSAGFKSTMFFNAWISQADGSVQLEEANCVQVLSSYGLTLRTTDLRGADFDGAVFVTLYGSNGSTEEMRVPSTMGVSFRRGASDQFTVRGADVGTVNALTIRIEPTEDDPAWHLDEVVVDSHTTGASVTFTHNNWLSTTNASAYIYRTNPPTDYVVNLYTADVAGAAFDGDVYITLTGPLGSTGEQLLVNESPSLAQGSNEEFKIRAGDVGTVRAAQLRLAKTANTSRWLSSRIEVRHVSKDITSTFLYAPIAAAAPADAAAAPAAAPAPAADAQQGWISVDDGTVDLKKDVPDIEYKVVVVSGDNNGDGGDYDGDVYITVMGSDATTQPIKLVKEDAKGVRPFSISATDTFTFKASNVGTVSSIKIKADMTGAVQRWMLSTVEVTPSGGSPVLFKYNSTIWSWSNEAEMSISSIATYKVTITVGDEPEAEFDGEVMVQINSWYGSTDEVALTAAMIEEPLAAAPADGPAAPAGAKEPKERRPSAAVKQDAKASGPLGFPRGSSRTFVIKGSDVGSLNSLYMRLLPGPSGKCRMHVAKVEVLMESSGKRGILHKNDFVDDSAYMYLKCFHSNKVTLSLGDMEQAFDGEVYMTMEGSDGPGEEVLLFNKEAASSLTGGSSSEVEVQVMDYGYNPTLKLRTAGGSSDRVLAVRSVKLHNIYQDCKYSFWLGTKIQMGSTATAVVLSTKEYELAVVSSNVPGNGTDASVVMVLRGERGETPEISLVSGQPDKDTEGGSMATMVQSLPDLGAFTELEVRLKDPSTTNPAHSDWHLEEVRLVERENGSMVVFPHKAWIARGGSATLQPASKAQDAYMDHVITVRTLPEGDPSNFFQGYVELQLVAAGGSERRSQPLKLEGGATWAPGATASFTVRAADLGDLAKAIVSLSSTNSMPLPLVSIGVLNTSTRKTNLFLHNKTIQYYDGSTELAAAASNTYTSISSTTASDCAGFQGCIYFTIHGEKGDSQEIKMYEQEEGYQPGSYNSASDYTFDIGAPRELSIRLEPQGSNSSASWSVSENGIDVYISGQGYTNFKPAGPIRVGAGGKATRVKRHVVLQDYVLRTHTMDARGASTDARVFFTLAGDSGKSDEVELQPEVVGGQPDPTVFTRGKVDTFKLRLPDVGANKKATVRLAAPEGSSQFHSSWQVAKLELSDLSSDMLTTFMHNGWVEKEATLTETSSAVETATYRLVLHTSDLKDADFSGEVYITLADGSGVETEEVQLDTSAMAAPAFVRGQSAEFNVKAKNLSDGVKRATVRIVPTATDPQWHLDKLEVFNNASSDSATFFHGQWLKAGAPSATMARTTPLADWEVVLAVAEAQAVPFDGEVYLVLQGIDESSEETQLVNDATAFEAKSRQAFKIQAADVGVLKSITLRVTKVDGGANKGSSLELARVEVLNKSSEKSFTFLPTASLSVDKAPSLTVSPDLPECEYRLTIATADDEGNAFDGDVYVMLCGQDGVSSELKLGQPVKSVSAKDAAAAEGAAGAAAGAGAGAPPAAPAAGAAPVAAGPAKAFGQGMVDTFVVKAGDVGPITWLNLRVDCAGSSQSWRLTSVDLVNPRSKVQSKLSQGTSFNSSWCTETKLYPPSLTTYRVKLVLPDKAPACDAKLLMRLDGTWSTWQEEVEVALPEGQARWGPGPQEVQAVVKAGWDVGLPSTAWMRLAPDSKSSQLQLSSMEIVNESCNYAAAFKGDTITKGEEPTTLSGVRMVDYEVTVSTLDQEGAAFNGEVLITLTGEDGTQVGPAKLAPPEERRVFGQGSSEACSVRLQDTQCKVASVLLQLIPGSTKDASQAWGLGSLTVYNTYQGYRSTFFHAATIQAPAKKQLDALADVTYELVVTTASARGAGTNGRVYATLEGSQGSSGEKYLYSQWSWDFDSGRVDTFTFTCPDLGEVSKLTLRLTDEGYGLHSGWLLSHVEVGDSRKPGGPKLLFPHNDWITAAAPSATLTPKNGSSKPPAPAAPAAPASAAASPAASPSKPASVAAESTKDEAPAAPGSVAGGSVKDAVASRASSVTGASAKDAVQTSPGSVTAGSVAGGSTKDAAPAARESVAGSTMDAGPSGPGSVAGGSPGSLHGGSTKNAGPAAPESVAGGSTKDAVPASPGSVAGSDIAASAVSRQSAGSRLGAKAVSAPDGAGAAALADMEPPSPGAVSGDMMASLGGSSGISRAPSVTAGSKAGGAPPVVTEVQEQSEDEDDDEDDDDEDEDIDFDEDEEEEGSVDLTPGLQAANK